MFWWLYKSPYRVEDPSKPWPIILWLQGGPVSVSYIRKYKNRKKNKTPSKLYCMFYSVLNTFQSAIQCFMYMLQVQTTNSVYM